MKADIHPFIRDQVPAEVETRLRERLEVFQKSLAGKMDKKPFPPLLRFAVVGLVLAGVLIAGAVFFPGRAKVNGLYAAVIHDLSNKHTLAYTIVTSLFKIDVLSKYPGLERKAVSLGVDMITDDNQGKSLVLFHKEKTYIWRSSKGMSNGLDNLDVFENLPDQADQELGIRIIDGKTALGFRVTKRSRSSDLLGHTDIWIDPVSRQLILVDRDVENNGAVSHILEIRNIRINQPLEDSLFALTPPADYAFSNGSLGPFFSLIPSEK